MDESSNYRRLVRSKLRGGRKRGNWDRLSRYPREQYVEWGKKGGNPWLKATKGRNFNDITVKEIIGNLSKLGEED